MRNQFYYTEVEVIPAKNEGEEAQVNKKLNSFNVDKVIRTVEIDNKLLVVLDDIHQRIEQVPVFNKQGKHYGEYKKETSTVQSSIYLTEKGDIKRFRELTTIE